MNLLDPLERRFGRWAIPGVTLYLVFFQSLCFVFIMARPTYGEHLVLISSRVLHGEPWRVVTFLLEPGSRKPLWVIFKLWFFYFVGTALESHWGAFRYNIYLLIGWLATIAASFLLPDGIATNAFIGLSVFLAFAYLWPDFEIRLFFILPVRVKWLALIAWIGVGLTFLIGTPMMRIMAVVPVLNFLLFFGSSLAHRAGYKEPRLSAKSVREGKGEPAFHTCVICGVTDTSNRKMEFRYCPDCAGTPCYCIDHINAHEHRLAADG
jgi:hypothetical protein